MAWFRCKFRKKGNPVISYTVTCGGYNGTREYKKYIDGVLVDSWTKGGTSKYAPICEGSKLSTRNDSETLFLCNTNYIIYNDTKYSTSNYPFLSWPNRNARTTFTFIESDE